MKLSFKFRPSSVLQSISFLDSDLIGNEPLGCYFGDKSSNELHMSELVQMELL